MGSRSNICTCFLPSTKTHHQPNSVLRKSIYNFSVYSYFLIILRHSDSDYAGIGKGIGSNENSRPASTNRKKEKDGRGMYMEYGRVLHGILHLSVCHLSVSLKEFGNCSYNNTNC